MSYETILYEKLEDLAIITLNRSDSMNSLEENLKSDLYAATKAAADDKGVRALILTGSGRAFCAGGDLKRFSRGFDSVSAVEYVKEIHPWVLQWFNIQKPTIAAVNGYAVGAGMSIILLCDIIIASEKARFSSAFINMGLVPDLAATYLLPRAVGVHRAKELLYSGRQIDASEALAMGLVNRVIPHEKLTDEALTLARRLADRPSFALAGTKNMVNRALDLDLKSLLELEAHIQGLCFNTEDSSEAISAFLNSSSKTSG